MSGDLVSGRFPVTYPFAKALGLASNNAQGNITARSSLEYLGLSGLADTAAALTSGAVTLVPVPVETGDLIQFVDVIVGATAAGAPTHSWAALYSASGVLLGSQSVDGGAGAIAASGRFSFSLGAKYIVQVADAPGGFVYAGVSVTATTVPSLSAASIAAAVGYQRFTGAPAFYAATSGTGLAGVAPASVSLSGATRQAAVPEVYLR